MNEVEKVLINLGEKTLEEALTMLKPSIETYVKDAINVANTALGLSGNSVSVTTPGIDMGKVVLTLTINVEKK